MFDNFGGQYYNSYIYGLVAQLGAHHIRIVGVGSSNLLESTNKKSTHQGGFFIGMVFTRGDSNDQIQQSGGLLSDG